MLYQILLLLLFIGEDFLRLFNVCLILFLHILAKTICLNKTPPPPPQKNNKTKVLCSQDYVNASNFGYHVFLLTKLLNYLAFQYYEGYSRNAS